MEMSHQAGAEAESLLRQERGAVVMPGQRQGRWDGADEKAPFLRNEPVKLTPAWEGNNLPNDTLNLKGIAMDTSEPKDKWHLIFLTFLLHGLGTLTAWNMFITAKDYFVKYKLVNAPTYSEHYLAYVGWASQIPNLVFSWLNIFVKPKGNLTNRIVMSLIVEVVIFVFNVILAMMDSSGWPAAFFWLTMLSVFFLNGFNAIFQNSVYGVAALLPAKYTGAVVMGSNLCGLLIVFLNWCSVMFDNPRTAAIYYFIGGMFVMLICIDSYFALPLNKFYRYHESLQEQHKNAEADKPPGLRVSRAKIFAQASLQLYNVFITFVVTLAVFPSVISDIEPNTEGFLGENFVRITCFLTFNVTALLGNVTASLKQIPGPKWLVIFTTIRLVFIPFFLLCKYKSATRTLPILISNDYVFWIASALMGWTSGHGSSLAMMYIGGTVPPEQQGTAGMMGGAMLVTGIITGITFTRLCPIIVTADIWRSL
nr:equilibrative nucleoside transporter 1 isoform X1 [Helicoverpa armigera]